MPKSFVYIGFLILSFIFFGCKEDVLPKPSAQLRLDYEMANYMQFDSPCDFNFDHNTETKVNVKDNCDVTIQYPKMKTTRLKDHACTKTRRKA